jgi:hypothetical protein
MECLVLSSCDPEEIYSTTYNGKIDSFNKKIDDSLDECEYIGFDRNKIVELGDGDNSYYLIKIFHEYTGKFNEIDFCVKFNTHTKNPNKEKDIYDDHEIESIQNTEWFTEIKSLFISNYVCEIALSDILDDADFELMLEHKQGELYELANKKYPRWQQDFSNKDLVDYLYGDIMYLIDCNKEITIK